MSSFQKEMVQGSLGDTWHRRCSNPEFKNWDGKRGLCWWRKQNKQSLDGMENLEHV